MRDAVAVGDDQRGAGIRLRLAERLDRLLVVGAEGDVGDVDVPVGDRLEPEVLLGDRFARRGELGRRAERRRLGLLAAGVRVDLGVEHQDVHVAAEREHVVEAAVADVVGPAVAADEPDRFLDQVVGAPLERARLRIVDPGQRLAQCVPPARAARRCPPRPIGRRSRSSAASSFGERSGELARRARAPGPGARRPPAGSRARTRRCPRRASSTTRGRGRRRSSCRAWSVGCRRRSRSSRSRWR